MPIVRERFTAKPGYCILFGVSQRPPLPGDQVDQATVGSGRTTPGFAIGKQLRMQILFYFVIVLHVIVCFFLIGVVLLQQGRSADLAGAFGGQGSQTAFGPRAAANVLTRLTTWSAIIFMCTSISLVVLFVRSSGSHSVLEGTHSAPVSAPAKPGK
jgi:preprotein translocase subunit SecG